MSEVIVPPTLAALLAGCTSCFQARSYLTFEWLVLGWVQCQGRRTITTVALASGALGRRHISVFHRFLSRASWSLDALGRVVFTLALAWVPADQPLVVLGDDTLARQGGKSIALASMHHDPLLSSARKPFSSFGHVWVVLALWVPLPFGNARHSNSSSTNWTTLVSLPSFRARAASSASFGDTGRSASGAAVVPSSNNWLCAPPFLHGRCPASRVVRRAPPPTAAWRLLGIPPLRPLLITG